MAQTIHNTSPTDPQTGQPDNCSTDQPTPEQASLTAPGTLKIADLAPGQGLTDRYDDLLLKLCNTAAHLSPTALEDAALRFCHHIRHTLNADTAYLCNRASLSVVTTSSGNGNCETCEDTQSIHSALITMVSDLWNCTTPLCPPVIKVYPNEPGFNYLVIPLATQHDHLLIIVNAEIDTSLASDYLADTVTTIYEVFQNNAGTIPTASVCQQVIFDKLQSTYRISSDTITRARLDLFKNQLSTHAAEFEGLSLASKSTNASELQTSLPDSLYKTAQLWNNNFKSLLDCHALIESAHGYKTLCENENLYKFSDSRALKVRVHAESLTDLYYIATVQELTEKSVIHASRLAFSVIPQPGHEHSDELKKLKDRFGIPHTIASPEAKTSFNIAGEFDIMQVNGIKKATASKQS